MWTILFACPSHNHHLQCTWNCPIMQAHPQHHLKVIPRHNILTPLLYNFLLENKLIPIIYQFQVSIIGCLIVDDSKVGNGHPFYPTTTVFFSLISPLVPQHSITPQYIPNRIMSDPVFITQEETFQSFNEESRDKDGFPELPISSAARAFCDLIAPGNKGDIKVRAHYRRRHSFKKPTVKKPKQSTLKGWFLACPPPKQPVTPISNKRKPQKKNTEKEDHSFAISLHIQEMRDVLSASRNMPKST